MNISDFLEMSDRRFAEPCLSHFEFLKSRHGFSVEGIAIANETVVNYTKADLRIQVFYAIPELPFLVLQRIENGKILQEKQWHVRKRGGLSKVVTTFERNRATKSFKKWWEEYESGDFDESIAIVVEELSQMVKDRLSRLLRGDLAL